MGKIADLMLMAAGGSPTLDLTFYESRYGSTMGNVDVYVVDTSGNIQGSAVYTASGDDGLTGGWAQRTATAVDVSGTFRIAWYYRSGSSFTGDYAIDTVSLQGNSYNFDSTNDGFVRSTSSTSSSTTAFSSAAPVATSTTDYLLWSRNSGGTPSNGTGPTAAQSGSFYLYCEATDPRSSFNANFWLFSPEITV